MRRWLLVLAGAILAPAIWLGGALIRYDVFIRPARLSGAGAVDYVAMRPDVAQESVIPPATGSENGAAFYLRALNHYDARRRPYLLKRGLNPFVQEPPVDPDELALMVQGGNQRASGFYAELRGHPQLIFLTVPAGKPWPMAVAIDPTEMRPYIGPMRVLGQGMLNRGKEWERQGSAATAELAYVTCARFGRHLRESPGSIMDIELGLEIERKALHYLDALYGREKNPAKRNGALRYGGALERLQQAVRKKYAQFDVPEVAQLVLERDAERVWRIEAAHALVSAQHYRPLGFLESWSIRRSLRDALHDPDGHVREAVRRLVNLPESEFRTPPTPPKGEE